MNTKTVSDLEVLEKYLSEEELKAVAKEVAYNVFNSNIGEKNPHRKSNIDYFIQRGAMEAVMEYFSEDELKELVTDLKEKTRANIRKLSIYDLPKNYKDIAREEVELMSQDIKDKVREVVNDFVNGDEFDDLYNNTADYIGNCFTDILRESLETKFKK